jgi:hypothetical protein
MSLGTFTQLNQSKQTVVFSHSRLSGLWAHVTHYLVSYVCMCEDVCVCVCAPLAAASNVMYSNTDARHVVAWLVEMSCCDFHD